MKLSPGGRRPTYAILLLIFIVMALGAWRRQSARSTLAVERERLLDARQTVLGLERELLLARSEEAEALSTGRASLHRRLEERQQEIQDRLEEVVRALGPLLRTSDTQVLISALEKYRQSVARALELSSRLGRGPEGSNLIAGLRDLEDRLMSSTSAGDVRLELLELKVLEREYAATLNTSLAMDMLSRVDKLRSGLREQKARGSELADNLDDYRRQVESVMSSNLELELQRSEATLRFERLPPIFRDIESHLDLRLEQTAGGLAKLRREAAWQVSLILAAALLLIALRFRTERLQARRTVKAIRQLEDGMGAFADGAKVADLELPRRGDLGKITASFTSMGEQIRSQISTIDQERYRAEEAARAKADFLARVSHELRTPLHGILGMSEILGASGLDSDQAHLLQILHSSGSNLLSMVNDLLDFERLEAGKLTLEPQSFQLLDLCEDLLATLAPTAHGKSLELVLKTPDQLPAQVFADGLRLNQILTNLVGNAIKFTESGHVELEVGEVEPTAEDRGLLRLTVRDTGPGIDATQREKIFEPFSQGERFMLRSHGGSGLGLSIVQELVTLMGGSIRLVDDGNGDVSPTHGGKGACFEASVEVGIVEEPLATGSPPLDGLCVGVLEEHEPSLKSLVGQLERLGMRARVLSGPGPQEPTEDLSVIIAGYPAQKDKPETAYLKQWLMDRGLPSIFLLPTVSWASEVQKDLETGKSADKRMPAFQVLRRPPRCEHLQDAIDMLVREPSSVGSGAHPSTTPQLSTRLRGRALLVEDNAINREVVELMLKDTGCEVVVAGNGREAVERVTRERFDLVLMDCQMPVMNGFEATEAIRRLEDRSRAETPIVALTASALPEERQRCLDCGMDAVISKPASQETLLEYVQRYIASS